MAAKKKEYCNECGTYLFNKQRGSIYCDECGTHRNRARCMLAQHRRTLIDRPVADKISFYLKAIDEARKSLETRIDAYSEELNSLGYNYEGTETEEVKQRRLI